MPDVDAVNSGYARVLLEQYLENPEAVPSEWRALFESGDGDLIESLPGLARLLENLRETNGHTEPAPAPAVAPAPTLDAAPTAPDHEQRIWLRAAIESGRYRRKLSPEEKKHLLARLSEVEGLEHYLRRVFLGQKQFSVEGLDTMIPMLDEAIDLAAEGGAHEVVI